MNTDKASQNISTEAIRSAISTVESHGKYKATTELARKQLALLNNAIAWQKLAIEERDKTIAAKDAEIQEMKTFSGLDRRVQEAREQMASKACAILCRQCDRAVRAECKENEGQCPECVAIRQAAKE